MIAPGTKVNLEFPVKAVIGGQPTESTFARLLTRRTIVSVYMKNNTPSCDRQNESLTGQAGEFARAGYDLIAVSRDSCGSHTRYAAAKAIPYVLVSDPEDRFAQATDSIVQKSMYGRTFKGPVRAAYVLEVDGTLLAVIPKVDSANHGDQLRTLIKSL
jgi:peroxiredoxin Q/BCP